MKNKDVKVEVKFDMPLLMITLLLLAIGLIMVASASSYSALAKHADQNYFLKSQAKYAVIGLIGMAVACNIDYKKYKKWSYIIFALALLLMGAVFVPGIGNNAKGATRWIAIGNMSFQPSEFMKIALAMCMAKFITDKYKDMGRFKNVFLLCMIFASVVMVLFFQNHFSAVIVMGAIAFSIFVNSGVKLKARYIIAGLFLVAVAAYFFLFGLPWEKPVDGEKKSFRLERILAHLEGDEGDSKTSWQINQSIYAVGSGGLIGRGLGQSRQKYLYLPEAQNDFIFAIYAEEFGFIGCAGLILFFGIFVYRGYIIAANQKDLYAMLVACGITTMFAVQIVINIAVVTKIIPVTGMPLPFFSYGGTALIINLLAVGILLNISKNAETQGGER